MWRRHLALGVAIGMTCSAALAGTGGSARAPQLSQAPFTYILDYGPDHLNSPEYLAKIRQAPPTLLHLGKDVPFTHNWGPIQATGGENQAYGKRKPYAPEDYTRRLSPDETRQRLEDLTRLARELHHANVKWVTPYICSMTIGGHPERRAGFWEFLDHWGEYKAFHLGARPASDPITWIQQTAEGKPLFFYKFDGPFYPPYEPNIRYAVCQNHPDWRAWTERVVENVARCGFDGVFVDNGSSLRCYCQHCQAQWRIWIDGRYSAAQRRELFGAEQPPMGEDKQPGLLCAETHRFWCDSLRQHLAVISAAGTRILGRPFVVFPNGGEKRPESILHVYPETDLVMFERSVGPHGTHPGMVLRPIVEKIAVKKYNDNIFEYKYVQCLRRKVRPIMLTRPGWQVSREEQRLLEMNPGSAALGNAEAAAFGGGGGFLQRATPELMQVQWQYRQFFERHARLYEGLDSLAEVAVAVFPDLVWFGNRQHQTEIRAATQHLLDGHVLFDYLIAEQFSYANLKKYAAIVLPQVSHLAEAQLAAVQRYLHEGGTLIVTGKAPQADELGRVQDPQPLAPWLAAAEAQGTATQRRGRGVCVLMRSLPAEGGQLVDILQKAAARSFATLAGPQDPAWAKVRVNAFQRPGQAQWVLHLVNYNVPLGVESREPAVQGPLKVTLRLPAGLSEAKIRCHDPQGEAIEIQSTFRNSELRFTLPELRIYKVLEITGR